MGAYIHGSWGGGANNRMYYSLFVNGPVTGGTSKWGEGGLITGCDYFFFVYKYNGFVTGGTYKWGRGLTSVREGANFLDVFFVVVYR